MLSDKSILERMSGGGLTISPFNPEFLQPASYDIHLGSTFRVFVNSHRAQIIDPEQDQSHLWEVIEIPEGEAFILHPGDFALGASAEWFAFPDDMLGDLDGKSSLGRLGLLVHATAGYFDPGFQGTATLELSSVIPMPIRLRPGIKIGQMRFATTSTPVMRAYGSDGLGSHYHRQRNPEPSRPL